MPEVSAGTHHLPRPVSGEGDDHQGGVHKEAVLIEGVVPVVPGDIHEVPAQEEGRGHLGPWTGPWHLKAEKVPLLLTNPPVRISLPSS